MAAFDIKRFDVILADLPVQKSTQKGENGKPFSVDGTELHGSHSCVVLCCDPDNQYYIVIPLSSALNVRGGEKWDVWKKSWHRFTHKNTVVAALCEQVRYICRSRVLKVDGWVGEYDQQKIDERVRGLLGL